MVCPNCNVENIDGSKHCFLCGKSFVDEPVEIKEEKKIVEESIPVQKKNTKIILFVSILVVSLLAMVSIFIFLMIGKEKTEGSVISLESPIIIEKNGLYGYIDYSGKVIIEPAYSSASIFYGDYAIVSYPEKEDTIYALIDKKGNKKYTSYSEYGIEFFDSTNKWYFDDSFYDKDLKKITPEKTYVDFFYKDDDYTSWVNTDSHTGGIINRDGKISYTYNFKNDEDYISIDESEVDSFFTNRYCTVNIENEKYAIVNCDTGKVVYDFTTDYISESENNFFRISDHKTFDTKKEIYINNDKVLYENIDDNIFYNFDEVGHYFEIDNYKEDTTTYLNPLTGKVTSTLPSIKVDESIYSNEWEEYTKITKESCDGGVLLKKGKKNIVKCKWEDIEYLDLNLYKILLSKGKSYVITMKDKTAYLYDISKNKEIYKFNSSFVNLYEGSTFISYVDNKDNETYLFNIVTLKKMKVDSVDDIIFGLNYYIKDNNYYNMNFKKIFTN